MQSQGRVFGSATQPNSATMYQTSFGAFWNYELKLVMNELAYVPVAVDKRFFPLLLSPFPTKIGTACVQLALVWPVASADLPMVQVSP